MDTISPRNARKLVNALEKMRETFGTDKTSFCCVIRTPRQTYNDWLKGGTITEDAVYRVATALQFSSEDFCRRSRATAKCLAVVAALLTRF